jgi:outer membrane protein OmpU
MINIKKIGLTALAGSLVAVSAYAGELSVSGAAKMSYTANTGNEDTLTDGSRFGLNNAVTFSGSGELDNGHIVSLSHTIDADAATNALSSSILTYDMGDLGKITYNQDSAAMGIELIDDLTPTADEEIFNGIDAGQTTTNEGVVGYANGLGNSGFNYNYSAMDGVSIDIGYSPKSTTGAVDDGGTSGAGALNSSQSIAVQYTAIDGLNIYAGTGEKGTGTSESDVDTFGVKYAFGPLTVGAQRTDIDIANSEADLETTAFGIAFAVNDNLSISYGESETEEDGTTTDQELSGFSIGYSMGGMTVKAHQNKGEGIANTAANESEHTEIAISFAF